MLQKCKNSVYLLTIAVVALLMSCSDKNDSDSKDTTSTNNTEKAPLFQKVLTSHSNIAFSNTLKEDVTTIENLFDFDYFYNGAGVGIEDLNNDGLKDIFFAGNQVPNKLYLNKGDLVFEDISDTALINENKVWANGVTFADVNQDGFMDVYVSQGGPKRSPDRGNLLYINQGDLTFKEEAVAYGLNDTGISTQSVFFDYDHDGDLDCFVSNENEFYGLDPKTFYYQMEIKKENLHKSSTHLYRNDNGKFIDVTEKAGVLAASFGLGLTVGDINNDGWEDIYVANDYYAPDVLYINNQDGTFSNETKTHLNQVSFYGMGVDIADINNDQLQDIFVLDMAASDHIRSKTLMASMNENLFAMLVDDMEMPYQYMFNSLQLNVGNNQFQNVSQLTGVSKTDWSWAGLLSDLDLDGFKDLYVTNGYRRYGSDNDSRQRITEAKQIYKGNVPMEVKQRLYNALPSEKLSNILYRNNQNLHFENETNDWGLNDPSFSNGASMADLDNDGDLDIVVNNIDETAFLYKNTTREQELANFLKVQTEGATSESFAKVFVEVNGTEQLVESKRVRGYLSSLENSAIFGLGNATKVERVRVEWPSGKMEEKTEVAANTVLRFREQDAQVSTPKAKQTTPFFKKNTAAGLQFTHQENTYNDFAKEVLLPYKQSTQGPFIAKGDVNGDGRDDVYIGGASGQAGQLFIQGNASFQPMSNAAFRTDRAAEDMEALFFDAEGDGDLDLYVVSGGNEFPENNRKYADRLYINNGSGAFKKSNDEVINSLTFSGKSVTAIDFDQDGDQDLVIGNRIQPQHYPVPAVSYLLVNDQGNFQRAEEHIIPKLSEIGMVNKIITTDFNNDGWQDLIAVGEWAGISMFENKQGTLQYISDDNGLSEQKGWWMSIAETDMNGDGLSDYIVGNMGENSKYKASEEKPLKVFAHDFDDNGTFDLVLSSKYKGRDVPFRGKECSTQQMPFISEKFESYNAFANASLYEVYGEKLNEAYQGVATTMQSIVLVNQGNGTFEQVALPVIAQKAPVTDIAITDVNKDGILDAILVGNIYDTEVETPRMDMGTGLILLGSENGYKAIHNENSGLSIDGNAKSLAVVTHPISGRTMLIAGVNNGKVQTFSLLD